MAATQTKRKVPQDHLPKKEDRFDPSDIVFDEVEGHELLIPIDEIEVEDQLMLTQKMIDLGLVSEDSGSVEVSDEGDSVDSTDINIGEFAEVVRYIRAHNVADAEKFRAFARGRGAQTRVLHLVVAYIGEMGKDGA